MILIIFKVSLFCLMMMISNFVGRSIFWMKGTTRS